MVISSNVEGTSLPQEYKELKLVSGKHGFSFEWNCHGKNKKMTLFDKIPNREARIAMAKDRSQSEGYRRTELQVNFRVHHVILEQETLII